MKKRNNIIITLLTLLVAVAIYLPVVEFGWVESTWAKAFAAFVSYAFAVAIRQLARLGVLKWKREIAITIIFIIIAILA